MPCSQRVTLASERSSDFRGALRQRAQRAMHAAHRRRRYPALPAAPATGAPTPKSVGRCCSIAVLDEPAVAIELERIAKARPRRTHVPSLRSSPVGTVRGTRPRHFVVFSTGHDKRRYARRGALGGPNQVVRASRRP